MKVWAKDTFSTYLITVNVEEGRLFFFFVLFFFFFPHKMLLNCKTEQLSDGFYFSMFFLLFPSLSFYWQMLSFLIQYNRTFSFLVGSVMWINQVSVEPDRMSWLQYILQKSKHIKCTVRLLTSLPVPVHDFPNCHKKKLTIFSSPPKTDTTTYSFF